MTNFTGANVIDATEVAKYQTDIFDFGIGSGTSEVAFFISQTTNDIFRELRIRWWPVYKTNVYTDITVLNTEEMVNTKINLDQFKRIHVSPKEKNLKFFLDVKTKYEQKAINKGLSPSYLVYKKV